jgi:hypothetical protein
MTKQTGPKRKSNTPRFPLTLDLYYEALDGPPTSGCGRTIELGSSAMSFSADRPLATGQWIDVFIEWPAPLADGVALQLIVSGTVARTDGALIGLTIQRHEFRTGSLAAAALPDRAVPKQHRKGGILLPLKDGN